LGNICFYPKAAEPQPSSLSLWERVRLRARPSANIRAKKADVENKDSKAAQPQPNLFASLSFLRGDKRGNDTRQHIAA